MKLVTSSNCIWRLRGVLSSFIEDVKSLGCFNEASYFSITELLNDSYVSWLKDEVNGYPLVVNSGLDEITVEAVNSVF